MKYLLLLLIVFIQPAYNPLSAQTIGKRSRHVNTKNAHHVNTTQNIYTVRFPKGRSTATISAYMLGLAHPVTFIVDVKKGKVLSAIINETGERGNIRINQLLMPGGKSDGPFSKSLNYRIRRKGTYKIIVGGSNMQGDDWKGAFTMRITIR